MPKPVPAQPMGAPTLGAHQWYALLPNGHQFFAHPRPLSKRELGQMRQRYAPWLNDLTQYLKAHPHGPGYLIDTIRQWAGARGIEIDDSLSAWPGIDYSKG